MLDLDRPLVVLDLEATGTDPETARIIQFAAMQIEDLGKGATVTAAITRLVDPGVRVPEPVQELTGISEEDLRDAPLFVEVAHELDRLIEGADLAGYNIVEYDYPLLENAYDRLGRPVPGPEDRALVDAYRLEKELNPRTLENTYERYTGQPMEDSHDAASDAKATWRVLRAQCAAHGLEGSSPAGLQKRQRGDYLDQGRKLKKRDDGSVEVCFGKHQGKTLRQLQQQHRDYLHWMYRKIDSIKPHIDTHFSDEQ